MKKVIRLTIVFMILFIGLAESKVVETYSCDRCKREIFTPMLWGLISSPIILRTCIAHNELTTEEFHLCPTCYNLVWSVIRLNYKVEKRKEK